MSKRGVQLLALLVSVALSVPLSSPQPASGQGTKVRLTQAVASFAFLPLNVANRAGFFTDEGIELEQIATQGGGPDLAALLAGEVEFNAAAGTYQVGAEKQGRALVNVFNYLNKNIINVALRKDVAERLGVTEDTPFQEKLAALKGLKIGVTRPGSLTDRQARYMVRLAGLDPDNDVEIVAIGGPPALLAAMQRKELDAFVISVPNASVAVASGDAILFINNAAGEDPNLVPFMMESIYTLPSFAEENPQIVTGVVRAVLRANQLILALPAEEIADLVAPDFEGIDRDILVSGVRLVRPAINPVGVLTLKGVENTLTMLDEQEVTAEALFASFTDEFIRAAILNR